MHAKKSLTSTKIMSIVEEALTDKEMEKIEGGSGCCVTGGANGVATGFCLLGSFLNPFVAVGCAGYGAWQYFNC